MRSRGWYCPRCGVTQELPAIAGPTTIRCCACQAVGLRPYRGDPPAMLSCSFENCGYREWQDGISDAMRLHLRRVHGITQGIDTP